MALVHGGASFRIFSETVYQFISGKDAADLIAAIEEVPDAQTRHFLYQVFDFTHRIDCTYIYFTVRSKTLMMSNS